MDIKILVYVCIVCFAAPLLPGFADCDSDAGNRVSESGQASSSVIIHMPMPMKTIYGDPGTRGESFELIDCRTFFKTEAISTNESYCCLSLTNDNGECSGAAFVASPTVFVHLQPHKTMQLAKYLAYAFMHRRAREESMINDKTLRAFWKFPHAIPPDFKYNGHRCSEYELTMVPFVVASDKIKGSLEEVVCKFSVSGKFAFALYVNLNELSVSLDFIEGSRCPALMSLLSRFPFLGRDEAYRQLEVIKKSRLEIIKEPCRGSGGAADVVIEVDV